uniref:Membrane protein BRI3 n=1 Tax=Bos mutus grunniens TaxID=30521 RepID=A0A8B9YXI8_BOSMU
MLGRGAGGGAPAGVQQRAPAQPLPHSARVGQTQLLPQPPQPLQEGPRRPSDLSATAALTCGRGAPRGRGRPAYNLEAGQGEFACAPHGYGAIAAAPPPPYPYLVTGIPTHHPRVYNIHSRNVTRYPANSIVVVGGCPVCRVGVLEDSFTFLGIFLAIVLFPFGFICCFALRKRRCPNCGANFT